MRHRGLLVAVAAGVALAVGAGLGAAPLTVAWDVLPPLPDPRTEVAAAAAGGKLWVLGGFAGDPAGTGLGSARVDVWDPAAGAWGRGPDLPLPVHHAAAVALGPRVVVIGGYVGLGFLPTALTWVLDTSAPAPAWQPFVPLPAPRGAHAAATDGQRIWVFGGAMGLFGLQSSALVLEPGAAAWRPVADFPDPRDHLAGAFLGGKVYAVGGRKLSTTTNSARLDVYDPATDAWSRGPDMPTPRGGIAAAATGGRLFVYGGEAPQGTFEEAEAYDPVAGAWERLAPMPTARHGLGAAVLGGGVHVVAGGPQPGLALSGAHERMRLGA